jgi:hypothetical protein
MTTIPPPSRLPILFLLCAIAQTTVAAEDVARIAFFRAIQDKAEYAKNPANYEQVVVNDRTGRHEYYIARQPAYVIRKSAIESITVREAKKYTATGEPFPETKSDSQGKNARRLPKFYEITFKIRSPEGKRFSVFTEKNNQGFFETMIGKQSIGLQEFDWPFEPDETGGLEFKVHMRQVDDTSSKKCYRPLKGS